LRAPILFFGVLFLLAGITGALFACGEEKKDEEKCPSFADQQMLPETGIAETEFVLWVKLRDRDANHNLAGMVAQLFNVDGRSANKTLDLVRVEDDPLKYIRTFKGSDVCASDTCTLYFHVIAEHQDGCERSFDTPLFQVTIGAADDDSAADDDTN
jgi:hypothetical protein